MKCKLIGSVVLFAFCDICFWFFISYSVHSGKQNAREVFSGLQSQVGAPKVAECFVGDLRVGGNSFILEQLQKNIVDIISADTFVCVGDTVYDEIPSHYIGRNATVKFGRDFHFVSKSEFPSMFPSLKTLRWRGTIDTPSFTEKEAPCMVGEGYFPARFRKFWPQMKGWECCLEILEDYEFQENIKYDVVVKSRIDVLLNTANLSGIINETAVSPTPVVRGVAYYHENLMCDHVHVASRSAFNVLSRTYHAFEHCEEMTFGGQQCCGGKPNQTNWIPPDWCHLPYTMENETECVVDRWLRTNSCGIRNDIKGTVQIFRWPGKKKEFHHSMLGKESKEVLPLTCPWV